MTSSIPSRDLHLNLVASASASERRTKPTESSKVSCIDCCMKRLCVTAGSETADMSVFDGIVEHWRPMAKAKHVYRAADAFKHVFLVRSGSVKTYHILENGEEQITGFYFPGEVFGLDGFADNAYQNGAVAMETTSVCAIPFNAFLDGKQQGNLIERRLLMLLSNLLNQREDHSRMLSRHKAHERIASFLMDLSQRFAHRGLLAHDFSLPMSRTDISNYMGLSVESVSRVFSRLQQENLIATTGRDVRVLNASELAIYAGLPLEDNLKEAM